MMNLGLTWWWLALPVLLLPVWWHRQKRQRLNSDTLATARFLPSADPRQLRVWRWSDPLLLLLRCALLVTLIAWLAATVFAWRGDTVLVDATADKVWVEQQITAAGFKDASRIEFCAAGGACTQPLGDLFAWLREQRRYWTDDARLLIVANGGSIAMPARPPLLALKTELRVKPRADVAAPAPLPHSIVVASTPERMAGWRALFAAFERAGAANARYVIGEAPDAKTELIVWDRDGQPPAAWKAPLWWTGPAARTAGGTPLLVNGLNLSYSDSTAGRRWSFAAWPTADASGAGALYDSWQALAYTPPAYPMPSQAVVPASAAAGSGSMQPAPWLAWLLLALFCLERILTHARRN